MSENDRIALDTLAPEFARQDHVGGPGVDAYRALVRRPDSATTANLLAMAGDSAWILAAYGSIVLSFADSMELADRAIRHVVTRGGPIGLGALHYLANQQAARGRWTAAKAIIDGFPPTDASCTGFAPSVAAIPFMPVPRPVLAEVRRRVEEADSVTTGRAIDRIAGQRRLYSLGVLDARLGEYERALREADAIQAMRVPQGFERPVAGLADQVRASVAFERGDYAATLALLDRVPETVPVSLLASASVSGARARYLRAESLFRLGRLREAQRWFENGFTGWAWGESEMLYRAECFLRLAEIHDRLGARDRAAHYYARALAVWNDPDPALRPVMASARERLMQLSGERVGGR